MLSLLIFSSSKCSIFSSKGCFISPFKRPFSPYKEFILFKSLILSSSKRFISPSKRPLSSSKRSPSSSLFFKGEDGEGSLDDDEAISDVVDDENDDDELEDELELELAELEDELAMCDNDDDRLEYELDELDEDEFVELGSSDGLGSSEVLSAKRVAAPA
ncbi:hypothetical protein AGMMS49592_4320 [Endomicrobiia bacterium]|nr:hypothetical protein AGMMS49592_4320 [Endomicrobiia bacterium]